MARMVSKTQRGSLRRSAAPGWPVTLSATIAPSIALRPVVTTRRSASGPISLNLLLAATLALLVAIAVVCLYSFGRRLTPYVSISREAAFEFELSGPSHAELMSRLSEHEQHRLAGHIHFISEIVRRKSRLKDERLAHQIATAIVLEAERANVDPFFVAAVVKSESTFNRHATSPVGAKGLMQLLPDTAQYISRVGQHSWQGVDALSDPNYNIRLGVSYLQYLSRKFRGNREHMLIAYNWGPGNLLSALKKQGSPPSSTVRYARTIMSDHARWADDFRQRRAQLRHMRLGNLLG